MREYVISPHHDAKAFQHMTRNIKDPMNKPIHDPRADILTERASFAGTDRTGWVVSTITDEGVLLVGKGPTKTESITDLHAKIAEYIDSDEGEETDVSDN